MGDSPGNAGLADGAIDWALQGLYTSAPQVHDEPFEVAVSELVQPGQMYLLDRGAFTVHEHLPIKLP